MTETDLRRQKDRFVAEHGDRAGKLAFLRWRALSDTFWFGAELLGHGAHRNRSTGRSRIDPAFHGWLCEQLDRDENALILIPRDHCKTFWTCIKVAQEILADPGGVRTAIFSLSEGLASKNLEFIRGILLNERVRSLFADVVPEPGNRFHNWEVSNRNQLTVRRPPGAPPVKENQLEAWGSGKRITGHHFQHIVLDDCVDQHNTGTAEQIQAVSEWVAYLLDMLDPTGKLTIIGTRYNFDDMYSRAMVGVVDNVIVRTATEPGRLDDPGAKPIYAFYTLEMLRELRDRKRQLTGSDEQFFAQYYNSPGAGEQKTFPDVIPTYDSLANPDAHTVFVTVDLAFTAHRTSDDCGLAVAYLDEHDRLWIEEALAMRAKWEVVCRELCRIVHEHRPAKIGVEKLRHQPFLSLWRHEMDAWERQHGRLDRYPAVEAMPVPKGAAKEKRIDMTLGAFVRARRCFVQEGQADLLRQMREFPHGRRDDVVDACSMAVILSGTTRRYVARPEEGPREMRAPTVAELATMIGQRVSGDYRWDEYF